MNHSNNQPPSQPRNGNGHKVSQRGLMSLVMLLVSIGALGFSLIGGVKLISDIFGEGGLTNKSLDGMGTKVIVVGLAYGVGWLTAMVGIRVYGNLILPMLIKWFTWGCLVGVCFLQVMVLQRLYEQGYDMLHYLAYLSIVGAGLAAMVGLHLIIEDHDLRPFAIPLLIISLIHLGLIMYRYVFNETADTSYLWKDLLFFFGMSAFSIFMLAHFGILKPLRMQLTNYFDRNSKSIRF